MKTITRTNPTNPLTAIKTIKAIKPIAHCLAAILLIPVLASCHKKGMEYDASGIFEATEVIVSAQGNGELLQFPVNEGDLLQAGQTVGLIDTTQLHLQKLQLAGSISSVRSRRTTPSMQIAATRQQIETQRRELTRFQNLVALNAANQKQVDDIRAQIELLERQLDAQNETLTGSNSSLVGETTALTAQIDQLDDQIQKSRITAPITGTVLAKYAEQGEIATQGRALFKMADIQSMFLRAYITASQLTTLQVGQPVKVYSDLGESDFRQYDGEITWIADRAEFTPKTIQTRDERANLVYAVKIAVVNDGYIKKGMYGEVSFQQQ